jgi:hypothetical protein
MAQAGQFGIRYDQVVERLYHALEWRYNEVKTKKGFQRETEILSRLLDMILSDQVGHDVPLHNVEEALHEFQRVRLDSFTPKKYANILSLMGLEERDTIDYRPFLYGNVELDSHSSAD